MSNKRTFSKSHRTRIHPIGQVFGLFLFLISFYALLWSLWPFARTREVLAAAPVEPTAIASPIPLPSATVKPVKPGDLPGTSGSELPTSGGGDGGDSLAAKPTDAPVAPGMEDRQVTLEWPAAIRQGDSDTIRLTIEPDAQVTVPTAEIVGNQTSTQNVSIQNLYETHHIIAISSLDMLGPTLVPATPIEQTLLPGQSLTYYWSIKADEVGSYAGTVNLKLRFVPKAGGASFEQTLYAKRITIEATNLVGMGGLPARIVGFFGSLVGGYLSMERFVGWGQTLFNRRKSGSAPPAKN